MIGVDGYISRKQDGTIGYLFKNAHGDVISAYSNTTNKIADYTYDAWGEQLTTGTQAWGASNPIRYNGQYYDTESGMTYLRARYYDSGIRRFITEDPIKDGVNWYAYAGNNPVMFVDSWGLSYDDVINALNNIYYQKNVMNSNNSKSYDYQEAYRSAMDSKRVIENSDVYIEDWSGLSNSLGEIVYGDNNSLGKIKTTRDAVQIAKKNSERQDFWDGTIFTTILTGGITLAIKGGQTIIGSLSSISNSALLTAPVAANELNHIFGKSQHNLGSFLDSFSGNQTAAYNAVRNAAQIYINNHNITNQIFNSTQNPLVINVNGFDITVGGSAIDGIFKIGTFFIK